MLKIFKNNIIIVFILKISLIYGQDSIVVKQSAIKVIRRAYNDSIKLRWAPTDYQSWRHGIKYGYIIERTTIMRDSKILDKKENLILTSSPIKPLSLKEWEKYAEKDDYVAIMAEAIYSSSFEIQTKTSPVIDIFNIASEQQNRYSFAMFSADCSPMAAKLGGLSYTDYNVKRGEKYLYKIYFAADLPGYNDTATVFTGTDEFHPLPKPLIYNIIPDENTIMLEWPADHETGIYIAYEVERSDDNGKTFKSVTKRPLVNIFSEGRLRESLYYIDTLSDLNKRYIYRIRGLNSFGERGPYSDTVSATLRLKIKTMPQIINHEATDKEITIDWIFDRKYENLLKSFRVMRSTKSNKDFIDISGDLPPSQRSYTDKKPLKTAYYKVVAIDKENSLIQSFPALVQITDTIPPEIPVFAYAKADTTGKVLICWYKNKEEDIYGYRLYRGNDLNEEFSLLTKLPVTDTFYIDTINLKTLTSAVYYRIMAVDNRQNQSLLSKPYKVRRPDKIPPVSPVIKEAVTGDNEICLKWIPSTSKDVWKYQIIRRETEKENQEVISEIFDTTGTYCDKDINPGTTYKYSVIAIDSSGLRSSLTQEIVVKYIDNKGSINLTGRVDRKSGKIKLIWQPVEGAEYYIYRSAGDRPMTLYKKVVTTNYEDHQVTPDEKYKYIIKALTTDKILLSNVEEVRY